MRINKAEVKTIYTIEYTFEDFVAALTNENARLGREHAFEGLPTEYNDETAVKLHRAFEANYGNHLHGHTFSVLAYTMGFDGWENAGYYNKRRGTRTMTVYRNGADEIK